MAKEEPKHTMGVHVTGLQSSAVGPQQFTPAVNMRVWMGDLRCMAVTRRSSVLASISAICMTAVCTLPSSVCTKIACSQ